MTTKIPAELSSTPGISDTSNATAITIDSSEEVGIGSTSPSAKLEVLGGSNSTYLKIGGDDTGTNARGLKFTSSASASFNGAVHTIDAPSSQGAIALSTHTTEKARISTAGNFFLGTTSGTAKFNMDYSSIFGKVLKYTGSNANPFAVVFDYGGSTVGSITITSSATSFNTSSDYRLKENINYEFDALDRVKQLKPARFNFIADADITVDGFIAHEVSDIVPEAITGEKDGEQMQGIDQSKLVPLLTKAIQEQQAIIEDLKSRIETLEG